MIEEKKYFMAGTDEEVLLGDVIVQTLEKDFKDGRKLSREVEFKLTEETLPYALEMGIIEEVEPEDEEKKNEDDTLDFNDGDCPLEETLEEVLEIQEDHDKRIEALESAIQVQDEMIKTMMRDLKNCIKDIDKAIKEEKPASSKKK